MNTGTAYLHPTRPRRPSSGGGTRTLLASIGLLLSIAFPAAGRAAESPIPAGEGLPAAWTVLTQRVDRARRELFEAQRSSEEQRREIHRELRELEAEIRELRDTIAARNNRQSALEARSGDQEKNVAGVERALEKSRTSLYALARNIASRLATVPGGRSSRLYAACRQILDDPLSHPPDPLPLLEALDAHLRSGRLGERAAGEARNASGIVHDGTWLRLGPGRWFAAHDAPGVAGPLFVDGPPPPAVAAVAENRARAVRAIIERQQAEADLPVDVTGATAAAHLAPKESGWLRDIRAGGAIMLPLILLGATAFGVALWRAIVLLRLKVPPPAAGQHLATLVRHDESKAAQKAAAVSWPAGPLLLQALKHRQDSREKLEEALHEQILGEVPRLEKQLTLLAVLAGVAPLLGLLGTVTGMIHTFDLVSLFGAGDVQILSGGISEALITTRTGLAIAIPTLLAHALLRRLSRSLIHRLESLAIAFVETCASPIDEPSTP